MNYKFSLKTNFQKRFPVYIASAILVSFLLSSLLISKNALKRNQIISFFIVSNGVKNETQLVEEVKQITKENQIRRVDINYVSPNSESYGTQFTYVGLKSSDIIIMPVSKVEKGSESYCFNPIESRNKFYDSTNYIYQETHYGILSHNDSKSFLNQYIQYGEDEYFIFLPKTSPHMMGFNDSSSTSNSVMLILEGLLK